MLTGNIGIHFDHERGILLWQVECRRIITEEFAGMAKPAVIELWPNGARRRKQWVLWSARAKRLFTQGLAWRRVIKCGLGVARSWSR
jgi:hypothetical protein